MTMGYPIAVMSSVAGSDVAFAPLESPECAALAQLNRDD